MMEVPDAAPVTIPDEDPIVATPVLPLVHVPPKDASYKFVVAPTHTVGTPVMMAGASFTVIVINDEQPVMLLV
jgi:hypothetical protein